MFELRLDDTHLQMAIEFEVEDAVAEQRAHKVQRLRSRLEYVEQEG